MTSPREPTSVYPDNPRSEWAFRWRVQPVRRADGLVAFEYEVYASARSRDLGDRPFFINSHLAQVRENHQRIALNPLGEMQHVSGIAVPVGDVEGFLERDLRAHRWRQVLTSGEWEDDRARRLAPFLFPTYQGVQEALDPQWVRERLTIPLDGQIMALIQERLKGVEARRQAGDYRGTTLDLQVGAGADDGDYSSSTGSGTRYNATAVNTGIGFFDHASIQQFNAWARLTGVSGLSGATVGVATYEIYVVATNGELTKLWADDQTTPAAVASQADGNGRTRTTAGVDWDAPFTLNAWNVSPSIVSIIQELADSYDPTTIQILHDDDGSATDDTHRVAPRTYEADTTLAAKLHIESTPAGGAVPVFDHHYRMQRVA